MEPKKDEINWVHTGLAFAGGLLVGFCAGVATGEDVKKFVDGTPAATTGGK
jgi:hypothetical protein